jgi:hypothetical protein
MSQFIPSYTKQHKHTLPRRKFSPTEDSRLRAVVDAIGTKSWEAVARMIPGRTARQCRDRYKNYLLDNLMSDAWTPEEDAKIIQKYTEMGPKWVKIALFLDGRSGNHVKNRWHKHLCKKFPIPPSLPPGDPERLVIPTNLQMNRQPTDIERARVSKEFESANGENGTFHCLQYGPSFF